MSIGVNRSPFRMTDRDLVIQIPALRHATLEEIRAEYDAIYAIESDTSTEQAVTLRLGTVLRITEARIDPESHERRLQNLRTKGLLLGFAHRKWLLENQDNPAAIPDPKVRAALRALLRKVYICFPGTVVRSSGSVSLCSPHIDDYCGQYWMPLWQDYVSCFHSNCRLAVSSEASASVDRD